MDPIKISLNISDKLTSISCGHIVSEIIKFIIYQRLQIPYTYQWLKQIVNSKKTKEEQGLKDNLQSERHYRMVSSSLKNLDFILKSVSQEIGGPSMPQEICITLGATPVTCKEVYRLILPTLCHKLQCQSLDILKDQNLQCSVFRSLVTSEALSQAFTKPLPPTNMHVFIKKQTTQSTILNNDYFLPASGSRIPKSSRVCVIDFRSNNLNLNCCNNFEVFGEALNEELDRLQLTSDKDVKDTFCEIQSTDKTKWYQSTYVMKGFKDCIINGSSVTNSWMES